MKTIILNMLFMLNYQHSYTQASLPSFASVRNSHIPFTDQSSIRSVNDSTIASQGIHSDIAFSIPTFYANRNKKVVELTWQPATEEGKSVFIIQKKLGTEWKTIAYVPCSSTSEDKMPSVYTYVDVNTSKQVTLYRIREEVDQGNTRPSEILSVPPERSHPFVAIYNPGTGKVRLSFKPDDVRDIKILTDKGQLVKEANQVRGKNIEIALHTAGTLNLVTREQSTGAVSVKKIYIK